MEHASRMIYMHRHPAARGQSRHPSAPCAGVEAQAEGTMLWACGIVLVRLLCAELPQDWVYRHGGLGSTEGLERELPPGHCLLRRGGGGCRDLLERIFSREATPTIAEVLMHDWVREARMAWNQSDAHAPEPPQAVQLALRAPPSAGADRWNAWIPLKDMRVEGKPPPLAKVKEIIDLAVAYSDGLFRQDGCPEAEPEGGAGAAPEDSVHEWRWRILVRTGDEIEEDALMAIQPPIEAAPLTESAPQPGVLRRTESSVVARRFAAGCFVVQVQAYACEDEPEEYGSLWWLRVRWLPPTLPGSRSSVSGLIADVYQDELRGLSGPYSNFLLLQRFLLYGRNEVIQRAQQEAERERRSSRAPGAGPALPGVGRAGPMLPGVGARSG
ncbi:unnamed protein product [Prorocentrum cordatum]|uniref:Protein kinase domain-containing protein n=1 Tax=Prorocentrum cordatum TaxID=2364126 RepID=A0ABN9W383_9DINO|nr:unnamed protein product [Polarella glacialis]